jgi:PTS system beta-glucosides-specific IIC component
MDYKKVAVEILDHVGGADNVKSFTHCATRLRFNLKDENLYKADALKITKGVMGSVVS